MRRFFRPGLAAAAANALGDGRRALADSPERSAIDEWDRRRRALERAGLIDALRGMVGHRERCMYCSDGRATDVEHFRPKGAQAWRALVCEWSNLLWACTACQRKKGARLPLGPDGQILLIDPTVVDPWDHLVLDVETGLLTARFLPNGQEDPLGVATVDGGYLALNVECVAEGRRRAIRALRQESARFLGEVESQVTVEALWVAVSAAEERGLASWFFLREGRGEEPFRTMAEGHPRVCAAIAAHLAPLPDGRR